MRIFDAHFHVIDYQYPIQENQGYLPSNYRVEGYEEVTRDLHISGESIVTGLFQGFDQG